jgi:hypothetical protein
MNSAMKRLEFTASNGVTWQVYAGTSAPKLSGSVQPADSGLFRPVRTWLAFDSDLERRRLTPAPPSWQSASPEELEQLLNRAIVIFKRPAEPDSAA